MKALLHLYAVLLLVCLSLVPAESAQIVTNPPWLSIKVVKAKWEFDSRKQEINLVNTVRLTNNSSFFTIAAIHKRRYVISDVRYVRHRGKNSQTIMVQKAPLSISYGAVHTEIYPKAYKDFNLRLPLSQYYKRNMPLFKQKLQAKTDRRHISVMLTHKFYCDVEYFKM